jgi:YVTN family beta-propeller protein
MKLGRLSVAILIAACVAGCGSNAAKVGVTVSPTTATVVERGTQQFSAVGSGSTTTTVNWQICLPPATVGNQPTNCTPLPGQTGTGPTGVGTITQASATQAGGLYTAPAAVPSTNPILVVATSTVDSTAFASATVTITSGITVQITPTTATIAPQDRFTFTATVSGPTNDRGVTWSVNGVAGGDSVHGFVCPNPLVPTPPACPAGTYVAPAQLPGAVTVTATSSADPTQSASASVTVSTASPSPTIGSIDPTTAAQGSVQQDVYINGSAVGGADFFSTSVVLVDGVPIVPTFINSNLLRVTIPSLLLQQAKVVNVQVRRSNGDTSPPANLTVAPVRPAVISSTPDSVSAMASSANVTLSGGFFFPPQAASGGGTMATFNGVSVAPTVVNSRQLIVPTPPNAVSTPGLYPIVVQNPDVSVNLSSVSAVNLAVTPNPASIPTAPGATIAVGASPSAIAIDPVLNLAAVANSGDGSVSLINLATNSVVKTIPVGKAPTGIAIDDQLQDHIALVVNSGDNTVSTVDLTTQAVVGTPFSVQIGAPPPPVAGPVPTAIGINPLTHQAIVVYQSTNLATVIDLSSGVPKNPTMQIGGSLTPYSTGVSPAIAIDPLLNWAVVTPGGAGTINIVDLGRNPIAGDGGRPAQVIGSLSISPSVQGVGINTETHQVLLTNPSGSTLQTFSLLDNSVNSISFTVNHLGYAAAAVNPMTNVGIAVNSQTSTAAVVDIGTGVILQTMVSGLGMMPQAVAVDPALNEALVVNQTSGTVSVISLGNSFRSLQITALNPAVAFAPAPANLTLTINGFGFVQGTSQVFLDMNPLPPGNVTVSNDGRQIVATVPASMLQSARRYSVTVQNPGPNVSNTTELTVVQPVVVGNLPSSVAVDPDRDIAVVTNNGDGTVSLVDLTTGTTLPQSPLTVGQHPIGVAVLPRLALAAVANNASSDVTVVDENGINPPQTVPLCAGCTGPTGVAIEQDLATAIVAASGPDPGCSTVTSGCEVSFVNLLTTGSAAGTSVQVNQSPVSVATDPNGDRYAAVGAASQAGSIDIIDLLTSTVTCRVSGVQLPSGVVFDPVNQVFVAANSLQNNIVIVDPLTCIPTTVRVGINPTSLDYDFQTSTLVTVNSASNTMSFLDYMCPSAVGAPVTCTTPQTRAIFGLPSSAKFSENQQFSVAIDAKLDLAVVVDTNNSRILLIPLPH